MHIPWVWPGLGRRDDRNETLRGLTRAGRKNSCWAFGVAELNWLQSCVGPDFKVPEAVNISGFPLDKFPATNTAGGKMQYLDIVRNVRGRARRQIENLEALKENQRFMNEATFLTLTSNVAAGAVQESSLRAQIAVTERPIRISKEILEKVRLQKNLGQVTELDIAAQEALAGQTEATLPHLRKALAQQRDALTALSGHLPGEGLPEKFEFQTPKLPQHLPVRLPSELISQRPDVQAAEENLHAACALIGVALANRLPQLSVNGDNGRGGSLFKNLFSTNPAFYFYTGLANASQTIFDGFTLQQRHRAAEAGFNQTAAEYRLAVLTAFQNVADALCAIRRDAVGLPKAILAEAAAAKPLKWTRVQLNGGQVSIQQVLNAQITYLQAALAVIQAQTKRFTGTVALFQALGGGWWNPASPPHKGAPEAWAHQRHRLGARSGCERVSGSHKQ